MRLFMFSPSATPPSFYLVTRCTLVWPRVTATHEDVRDKVREWLGWDVWS